MTAMHRPVGLGLAARGEVQRAVGYAREAAALGFESVWLHDSYFERDAVTYLSAIASEVAGIRLGAGSLNPYTRHPVLLAMTMSALDDLAPGRTVLALGSGLPFRLAQMNIPFEDRFGDVARAITVVRALWAGEPVRLSATAPPVQPMFPRPRRIPIYIAAWHRRFLEICGELGDGYLARPAESIPGLRAIRERVRASAIAHGRDPDGIEFAGYLLCHVDESRPAALAAARRDPFVIYMLAVLSDLSMRRAGFEPALRDRIAAAWRANDLEAAAAQIPDELLDAFLACGTVEEVAAKAAAFNEAGLDLPVLQPIRQEPEQVAAVLRVGVRYASAPPAHAPAALERPAAAPAPAPAPAVAPAGAGSSPLIATAAAPSPERERPAPLLELLRPFSFTASAIPVAVGGALALGQPGFSLLPLALALVGGVALQAGTNIINEIYDVRQGVDTLESPRASHAILAGRVSERQAFAAAFGAFALATLVGALLIALRGWPIAVLGLLGLLAGYSYTAPPFQYKYRGLGVPLVFLLMGPLMVLGGYFAASGEFALIPLIASLPVGCLVAAILHGNEWRDIAEDAGAGFSTLSSRLGAEHAHALYLGLVIGAYLLLAVAVMVGLLPPLALLALLSLPVLVTVLRGAELGATGQIPALAMIDLQTARLHMLFGLLLVAGLVLARLIPS